MAIRVPRATNYGSSWELILARLVVMQLIVIAHTHLNIMLFTELEYMHVKCYNIFKHNIPVCAQ